MLNTQKQGKSKPKKITKKRKNNIERKLQDRLNRIGKEIRFLSKYGINVSANISGIMGEFSIDSKTGGKYLKRRKIKN